MIEWDNDELYRNVTAQHNQIMALAGGANGLANNPYAINSLNAANNLNAVNNLSAADNDYNAFMGALGWCSQRIWHRFQRDWTVYLHAADGRGPYASAGSGGANIPGDVDSACVGCE